MQRYILLLIAFVTQINFAQNIFPVNGNVGIGTTTPISKLDVIGRTNISGLGNVSPILGSLTGGFNISAGGASVSYGIQSGFYNNGSYWIQSQTNDGSTIAYDIALNPLGGNIGIGTTSPIFKLQVEGGIGNGILYSANNTIKTVLGASATEAQIGSTSAHSLSFLTGSIERARIDTNGNVGIGTTSPISKLDVVGRTNISGLGNSTPILGSLIGGFNISAGSSNTSYGIQSGFYNIGTYWIQSQTNDGSTIAYDISLNPLGGNVGIGTTTPDSKLAVNGTIHSKEVKVDMSGWSDFVFKKEYDLPTLQDVEKHILEKGHLENIPSEEEVLKNGISLGEMNAKLLQKIEEMTLYMIEQNKKIEKQADEMETVKKENESFKSILERLSQIEQKLK